MTNIQQESLKLIDFHLKNISDEEFLKNYSLVKGNETLLAKDFLLDLDKKSITNLCLMINKTKVF